jgi:hypothetical protein
LAAAEKRIKVFVLMGGLPKVPPDWDHDSFYAQVQRATTPRAEFDRKAGMLAPVEPERFAVNAGPQPRVGLMSISMQSAAQPPVQRYGVEIRPRVVANERTRINVHRCASQ